MFVQRFYSFTSLLLDSSSGSEGFSYTLHQAIREAQTHSSSIHMIVQAPPCVMSCSSLASPLCPVLFCPTCQRCSSNHTSLARSIICICHPLSTDNSTVCLFVSASEPVCRACVYHAPFKRVKSTKPKKAVQTPGTGSYRSVPFSPPSLLI